MNTFSKVTPMRGMSYLNEDVLCHASSSEKDYPAESGISRCPDRFWRSGVRPVVFRPVTYSIDLMAPEDQERRRSRIKMSVEGATEYLNAEGTPRYFDILVSETHSQYEAGDEGWKVVTTIRENRRSTLLFDLDLSKASGVAFSFYDCSDKRDVRVRFDLYAGNTLNDSYLVVSDNEPKGVFGPTDPTSASWKFGSLEEQARVLSGGRPLLLVDAGEQSMTVAEALLRYEELYENVPTRNVLISLGTADALRGTPKQDFQSNLTELVHRFIATDKTVLISIVPYHLDLATDTQVREYNLVIRSIGAVLRQSGVSLGPDLYQVMQSSAAYDDNGDITTGGYFLIHRAWVLHFIRNVWHVDNFDAMIGKTGYELLSFWKWLDQSDCDNTQGVISDFGVPSDHPKYSQDQWNILLTAYLKMVRATGLHAFAWCSGGILNTTSRRHPLAIHHNKPSERGITQSSPIAEVYRREFRSHEGIVGYTISGPEAGSIERLYEEWWPNRQSLEYLVDNGAQNVRLLIGHESFQPELGEELDPFMLDRLFECLGAVIDTGLTVVLTLNNYGHYRLDDNTFEPLNTIGSYRPAHLADFWIRMSRWLRQNDKLNVVLALELMTAPYDVDSSEVEDACAQLVKKLRRDGERRILICPTANLSRVELITRTHDSKYVFDPCKNTWYAGRHFFNVLGGDRDGSYRSSYNEELEAAKAAGF